MGVGLKKSKVALFDLSFETGEASGETDRTEIDAFDDYYIACIGTDGLPYGQHDEVFCDETNDYLSVYLQDVNDTNNVRGNKTLSAGIFSDTIDKVSDEEFGDLNLKAKGVQYVKKGDNTYDLGENRQEYVEIPDESLIFSWSESSE